MRAVIHSYETSKIEIKIGGTANCIYLDIEINDRAEAIEFYLAPGVVQDFVNKLEAACVEFRGRIPAPAGEGVVLQQPEPFVIGYAQPNPVDNTGERLSADLDDDIPL